MRKRLFAACTLLLTTVTACDACAPHSPSPTGGSDSKPVPDAVSRFGIIEGVVRLADGAELPEVPPRMMYQQFLQQAEPLPPPSDCTPAKQSDRRPVQLGAGNVLASIFVAASDFKTPVSRPPKVHQLTIKDCRLTPAVIGAMRGDTLNIASETDYPFMPQIGGAGYIETLIKGQSRTQTLEALGAQSVLCAFTAPCGRSDIITVAHPLYALSDVQGRFRIEGVPTNETFNLNAWHPLFRASTQSIKLAPGETKQVEFVLSPEHQYTPSGQAELQRREAEAATPVPPGTRPD